MLHRQIPKTKLEVSQISLGTVGFGNTINRQDAFALLDCFVEHGGNLLDTAHVYSNWLAGEKHMSEKTIGLWMQSRQNRQKMIVSTKGGHPKLETMQLGRLSRLEIQTDLEESLKHLQTDWIDLYWLHRDDPSRPIEDILGTLNELVERGTIRYFGASNWSFERLKLAQDYAISHGLHGFVANQMMWSAAVIEPSTLPDQTMVVMDSKLFAYHQATGLAAMPYSAQANGLFQRILNGTLDQMNPALCRLYPLEANLERLRQIQRIRQTTNWTITQIVLSYLISQPFLTVPIVGCHTLKQLEDSLSAVAVNSTAPLLELFV